MYLRRSLSLCVALILAFNAEAATPTAMNPDVSISVLTLYKNARAEGAQKSEADGGFSLQETELQFMANVDPYLKASVLLSIHPAEDAASEEPAPLPTAPPSKSSAIEPEEVYVETIGLPYVTFKAGRFHAALGKHNGLHTHTFPFVDAPLINQRLLGADGLAETGLSASVLVPLPWFMELTTQAVQGDSPDLFASESSTDLATAYRLRNLWDLSDEATLDFGLSAAAGQNFYQERTTVQGGDLTLKWRPTQGGKYSALIWAAEYLQGNVRGRPAESQLAGYATWIQYQFAERWWVQARTEEAGSKDEGSAKQKKLSGLIAFLPSEFSGIRLQYDHLTEASKDPLNTLMLQGNITIGAHPAHAY